MKKLIKISVLTLALVLVSTLAVTNTVMAQEATADVALDETVTAEDLGVSKPATGIFGFFQNMANGVEYALTFNSIKKAELKLEHANDALLRAQNYLEENPDSIKAQEKYEKYMEKYENKMAQVQEQVQTIKDKAENNPKVDRFLNKLTENTFEQQRIMDHVSEFLDEDQLANLQEKRDNSLKTVGEALKNLSDTGNLPERLENAMNNQEGSRLIHLKNLEVLEALKNQVPAEALKGIQNAQDNAIKRLNEALQNIDPVERHNRFNEYLNNSNSDPLLQIETLAGLENGTISQDIKSLIPAIKNDKIERVDNMIEAFKNDEHKIKNLERVRQIEDPQTKTMLRQIENKYVNPDAPANTPLKAGDLKEGVRANYQEGTKPARQAGGVDKDKDIRDRLKAEEENTPRENIKEAIPEAVREGEKPVRMQEKVEGGVDKIKDVNQERVETLRKENQTQPAPSTESAQ